MSNIWAVRLQPVARYLPSAENRTQHTTLQPVDQNRNLHDRGRTCQTYLSCIRVCTKLASSTRFTLGLKTTNQSLASFFSSGHVVLSLAKVKLSRLRSSCEHCRNQYQSSESVLHTNRFHWHIFLPKNRSLGSSPCRSKVRS